VTLLRQEFGLDDPQRSLPTPSNILCVFLFMAVVGISSKNWCYPLTAFPNILTPFIQASYAGSSGCFRTAKCVISSRQLGAFSGVKHLAFPLCSVNFHVGFGWCDSATAGVVSLPLDLLPDRCFSISA